MKRSKTKKKTAVILDDETLRQAFKLYAEIESQSLPDDSELEKHTFSPEFEAKMQKLFDSL